MLVALALRLQHRNPVLKAQALGSKGLVLFVLGLELGLQGLEWDQLGALSQEHRAKRFHIIRKGVETGVHDLDESIKSAA